MAPEDDRCCFCRREVRIREWADRPGWLDVECPVCGHYRIERQFWIAAPFRRARKPAAYRTLAHWLEAHRDRAAPVEIPFDGWEAVAVPRSGAAPGGEPPGPATR
jgi:hypothetical protein